MLYANEGRFYTCQCLQQRPQAIGVNQVCLSTQRYLFGHSVQDASMGLARRAAPRATGSAQQFCPRGYQPCRTSADPSDTGYECLNVDMELSKWFSGVKTCLADPTASCGGCLYGSLAAKPGQNETVGQDCLTMQGANPFSVTCSRGKCLAAKCRSGYRKRNGLCIPRRS
jgi:hypothetical protein